MHKYLVRIVSILILISPWISIGSTLKDVFFVFAGMILLLSTVNMRRRRPVSDLDM